MHLTKNTYKFIIYENNKKDFFAYRRILHENLKLYEKQRQQGAFSKEEKRPIASLLSEAASLRNKLLS